MGQAVENRGPELLGVDALFLVLAVISTALRCFVRLRIVKAFGMDDWFMLGATISFVFYCACSITGIHYGTGHHHADLDPKDAQRAKHYWWFCYLAYCITMIASKTSIGLFLLRITIKRVHHWIIYVSMFMSIITAVVFFFVTIFQCQPVEYFWNQMEGQQGTCIKVEIIIGLAFLYSSINVIMDFSFALLPWFLISGLQLDKKTKIALIPLLGMGCIASSAVVVRLGYLMNFKDPDFLWVTVDIAIWSTVEEGLAITAGSLATLRPLLKLLTIKLGLSKPSNLEPSGYLPGSRLPVSGDGSKVLSGIKGEAHKMSKLSQRDVEGYGGNVEIESYSYGRHLQAYPTNANQAVGRDKPLPKSCVNRSTNESQEELHNGSSIETPGQEYKGVVVTKTWFITDDRDAP